MQIVPHQVPDPSPAEIAWRCYEIQCEWSEEERRKRMGEPEADLYRIPTVKARVRTPEH